MNFISAVAMSLDLLRPTRPKLSHLTLLQVQERVDPFYTALAKTANLTDLDGARIFAIATALLINDCKEIYNIVDGYALAVQGVVEGSKTMTRQER